MPDHTRLWNFQGSFRSNGIDSSGKAGADWKTLPQVSTVHARACVRAVYRRCMRIYVYFDLTSPCYTPHPQSLKAFKEAGWITVGCGKTFHPGQYKSYVYAVKFQYLSFNPFSFLCTRSYLICWCHLCRKAPHRTGMGPNRGRQNLAVATVNFYTPISIRPSRLVHKAQ